LPYEMKIKLLIIGYNNYSLKLILVTLTESLILI